LAKAEAQDWGYENSSAKPSPASTSKPDTGAKKGAAKRNVRTGANEPKVPQNSGQSKIAAPKLDQADSDSVPAAAQTAASTDTARSKEKRTLPKAQLKPVSTPEPTSALKRVSLSCQDCWMELFAVCASSPVDDDRKDLENMATLAADQKKELYDFLKKRQDLPQYAALEPIWNGLRGKVLTELDYKDSYRLLFRALLRHALGDPHTNLSKTEKEMFQMLLGPARISEMGPPVLTEDAINAYADMTCFLFQKRKPDRSIDGEENRQVFADVIKQRYQQAPNLQAKQAMCNFDLTWACFRCRYLALDEAGQARLSKLMASGEGKGELKAELTNPQTLKIFALGPWNEK
jgi:hypothetical protein